MSEAVRKLSWEQPHWAGYAWRCGCSDGGCDILLHAWDVGDTYVFECPDCSAAWEQDDFMFTGEAYS